MYAMIKNGEIYSEIGGARCGTVREGQAIFINDIAKCIH